MDMDNCSGVPTLSITGCRPQIKKSGDEVVQYPSLILHQTFMNSFPSNILFEIRRLQVNHPTAGHCTSFLVSNMSKHT